MIRMTRSAGTLVRTTGPAPTGRGTITPSQGKRELMKGIAVGIVLAIVGLIMWLTTKEVETPYVSLSKVGLVLAIVGGAEALFALLGLGKKANK
ncbi:DUF5708 family protein [Streptomyces sp. NPDC002446]